LKVTDAPGLQHRFNPHFYFTPRHREGVTRCAFDLRVEPGVEFYHEWRDAENPYRTGPSLWVSRGQLTVQGRRLLDVPAGQWVRLEIVVRLGRASTSQWDLSVTLSGQAPRKFPGLPSHPAWKSLDWLGFVSNGDAKGVLYLDNLELSNVTQ
jgi:hypothetical protein